MTPLPSDFELARDYVMPFGKHRGHTLDDIASTDDGLLYLDWLRGQKDAEKETSMASRETTRHLRTYLDDPGIAADLAKLVR